MEYHEAEKWVSCKYFDYRPLVVKNVFNDDRGGWILAFEIKNKGDKVGFIYNTGLNAGNRKAKIITHLTQAGFYRVRTGQREYKLMPPIGGIGSGFPIEFLKELAKGFKFEAKRVAPKKGVV